MSNLDSPHSRNNDEMLRLTMDIVSAYVSYNQLQAAQLGPMIKEIHQTLLALQSGEIADAERHKPAVSIKKSVTDEYLICLEDGKKLKMLKRYLRSRYNLSPEEYRQKWGLPADYPMVAPAYAEQRSRFAKEIGLGRTATKRRGRPKKAA